MEYSKLETHKVLHQLLEKHGKSKTIEIIKAIDTTYTISISLSEFSPDKEVIHKEAKPITNTFISTKALLEYLDYFEITTKDENKKKINEFIENTNETEFNVALVSPNRETMNLTIHKNTIKE